MKRKRKNPTNKKIFQQSSKPKEVNIWAEEHDWKNFKLDISTIKRLIVINIPLLILISIATCVLYINSAGGDFLIADDIPGIVQNPTVTKFDQALNTGKINTIIDSALFQIGKGTPQIFHVRSILLHALNAILVYILASLIFNKTISFVTTFLFIAHPINTEAVSWISAWIYLALTLFTLVTTILFILYRKTSQKSYMWAAVCVLATYILFFTDNWVLTIPLIVIVIDQTLIEKKLSFKVIKNYIPLLSLGVLHALYLLTTALNERIANLKNLYYNDIATATPFVQRVPYTAFYAWKQYIFPKDLTIYHEGYIISPTLFTVMIIFTILMTVAIFILLFKCRPIAGLMILVWLSILFSFSPVPVAWLMADRYLYRGGIFICMLIAIGLYYAEKKYKFSNFVKIGAISLFLAFSIRTVDRNVNWTSDKNLWTSTLDVAPYSARVYNNLGDVYFKEGDYPKAIKYFQTALQLKPDFADVVHNLGYTYLEMGDLNLARQYLIKSYEMNPYLYQSLYKLGFLEYKLGNFQASRDYFVKSLEINPQFEPSEKAIEILDLLIQEQAGNKEPVK